MPKKPPKNPFFYYMLYFKDEERRRGRHYSSLQEVSAAAAKTWEKMNTQERGPFDKQAKDAKNGPKKEVEKYTSQGIPLSLIAKEQNQLEQEHRTMLRTIKTTVVDAFTNNTIATQHFFFISGNYFVNINENYLPAEIAMVKFSFERGIVSKFHAFIDPEKVPMGYHFDAKENSDKTHRLPLPPNSKGERDYELILNTMKEFMGVPKVPPPIIFTSKENIPMIKSFIQLFIDYGNNDDIERYRVYPLHQFFFEIKEEAIKNNAIERPSFKSIHIAEEHLKRDDYAYLSNTACTYHEELDCAKHCALAHVQNWARILLDHICVDLDIELISGIQFPLEIDVSQVADATRNDVSVSSRLNDTKPIDTSDDSKDIDEARSSHSMAASDIPAPCWFARPKSPDSTQSSEDFPTLGSRNRKQTSKRTQGVIKDPWSSSSSSGDMNPWRQRRHFQSSDADSDEAPSFVGSDINASHSRGMGRGSVLYRSESGFGRGRSHK